MGLIPERGHWLNKRAEGNNPRRDSGNPDLSSAKPNQVESIQNLQGANTVFDKDSKIKPPSEKDIERSRSIIGELKKEDGKASTLTIGVSSGLAGLTLGGVGGYFIPKAIASDKSSEISINSFENTQNSPQMDRIIDNRNTNPVDNNVNNANNNNNSPDNSQPPILTTGDQEKEPTPIPSPTNNPASSESQEPTLTPTPEPTLQPTPTPTPEVENVPLGPAIFKFDIGEGVPEADVELVKEGIRLAQEELEKYYGGDIKRPIDKPITVKIVATGLGNQEVGGHGAPATALDESGARLFFDVLHPQALKADRIAKIGTVIHEYTHDWQNYLGCLTIHDQPLGGWMNEGIGSYVAIKALVRLGMVNDKISRYSAYYSAKTTGELGVPLESLNQAGIWPGHAGQLAIEDLVAHSPYGEMSLRIVCEKVAAGLSVEQAFEEAFGISMNEFYSVRFPSYLESLKKSPIYLAQASKVPAGSIGWVPGDSVAYELGFVAYGYEDLAQDQQNKAWKMPKEIHGRGSQQVGKMIVWLPSNTPAGTYPVSVTMPDGRTTEMQLIHTEE